MPIDASIYGQFAPRVQSVSDIQNGLAQQQTNALALQQGRVGLQNALQSQQDAAAVRSAAQGFGADQTANYNALLKTGNVKAATDYQKSIIDAQKAKADTNLATSHAANFDQKTSDEALAQYRSFLPMVKTPDDYGKWVDGMFTDPRTAKVAAQFGSPEQMKAQVAGMDPATFNDFLQKNAMGMDKYIANQTQVRGQDMTAATAKAGQGVQMRGQDISSATAIKTTGMREAGENARQGNTIANTRVLAGLNPDGSPKSVAMGADGTIDLKQINPEDLAAAQRYRTDGTFPPNMGRGVQGATEGRRIRAIASALDTQAGASPEDARVRQLALKGDVTAINQMRKREVAIGANVKNFDFNADQVEQLSRQVDRTGVPIANAWLNAGRRAVTGNPELSAFDTAIKTTVNEFAQIVSGTTAGATTEGEKKKAESLLNAQQTPEQLMATLKQMRIESQNRMKSFHDQRAEMMPTNGARPASTAAPAGKVVHFGDLK